MTNSPASCHHNGKGLMIGILKNPDRDKLSQKEFTGQTEELM
jgi:hypothetical protein